jgi:hypothetical protein
MTYRETEVYPGIRVGVSVLAGAGVSVQEEDEVLEVVMVWVSEALMKVFIKVVPMYQRRP